MPSSRYQDRRSSQVDNTNRTVEIMCHISQISCKLNSRCVFVLTLLRATSKMFQHVAFPKDINVKLCWHTIDSPLQKKISNYQHTFTFIYILYEVCLRLDFEPIHFPLPRWTLHLLSWKSGLYFKWVLFRNLKLIFIHEWI